MQLQINGQTHRVQAAPDKPLLWLLREDLALTGTKFGCGAAQCGACTVHIDGAATRCCVLPIQALKGRRITTIEALDQSRIGRALQQAWLDEQVPQCGYCQSGMLMAAAALLAEQRRPSEVQIKAAMSNLCRCGTYPRVRAAIERAATALQAGSTT
ncbi:(2Fe-2S)-binding protein [Paucibacter sp. B2R-40]|uniref:(2Fe-2S)-binding protein n=1 Tax=Paucibacter sp. B2R-40 TaxID=2893554 RepID=UPI0021E39CE7|nr:(2Fe-2S)-binding protein [Paucibacter sp. B2R-40]MCV2353454.1 (2Fe-2S)-binding protein [Paucibacter sp. B2R-40]